MTVLHIVIALVMAIGLWQMWENPFSTTYVVVSVFVGFLYYTLALQVLHRTESDSAAQIFHFLSLSVAILVCTTPGTENVTGPVMYTILQSVYAGSYLLVPVLLLHFVAVFPQRGSWYRSDVFKVAYFSIGAATVLANVILLLEACGFMHFPATAPDVYTAWIDGLKIVFSISSGVGLAVLVATYFRTENLSGRRKLLWLISGVSISAGGYIILSIIPEALGTTTFPEEWAILLTSVAPIAFATSIVRDRALDIDVIVNRGMVQVAITLIAVCIYSGFASLAMDYFRLQIDTRVLTPSIVLIDVLLFFPARGLVQQAVDWLFFRVQYRYRDAQIKAARELREALSQRDLLDRLYHHVTTAFAP